MTGWFSDNLAAGLALFAIAVHLSGLVSAVHAALRTRSTQGAVAWAILLVVIQGSALTVRDRKGVGFEGTLILLAYLGGLLISTTVS